MMRRWEAMERLDESGPRGAKELAHLALPGSRWKAQPVDLCEATSGPRPEARSGALEQGAALPPPAAGPQGVACPGAGASKLKALNCRRWIHHRKRRLPALAPTLLCPALPWNSSHDRIILRDLPAIYGSNPLSQALLRLLLCRGRDYSAARGGTQPA